MNSWNTWLYSVWKLSIEIEPQSGTKRQDLFYNSLVNLRDKRRIQFIEYKAESCEMIHLQDELNQEVCQVKIRIADEKGLAIELQFDKIKPPSQAEITFFATKKLMNIIIQPKGFLSYCRLAHVYMLNYLYLPVTLMDALDIRGTCPNNIMY